jgi:hypothetical protein
MSFLNKFKSGWTILSMDCRQAARVQSEQLDHPLPRAERLGLGLHLLCCQRCRRYGEQVHFLHKATHEHQEKLTEISSEGLSDEARERIKRRLQSENDPLA